MSQNTFEGKLFDRKYKIIAKLLNYTNLCFRRTVLFGVTVGQASLCNCSTSTSRTTILELFSWVLLN